MEPQNNTHHLGPILLAPGITVTHVVTKLYISFVGVAMLTGLSFLQSYILTEHLQIPRAQQGTLSGDLTFWAEVTVLILFTPFGVLSDRIGRRPVFVFGILFVGLGYGLYPFATSAGELLFYRLIAAVGVAAASGMSATLTNDYPQENSRGKLIGIVSVMNSLGVIFMAGAVAQLPALLIARGFDPVAAGKATFLLAASICAVSAIIARFGLKGGTPVARRERAHVYVLATSGIKAAKNPRIALSYAASFAARSDLVLKGLFLSLWAIQDGLARDMTAAEAMARFGLMMIIMQGASLAAAPIFGWFIDQVNRVSGAIVALAFATTGYLSMGLVTSPLDFAMMPYFIVLSLGSGFLMTSSLSLVGQDAPAKERGSIIAMNGTFGALGILLLTVIGGRLFDAWGPWAPFVIAGAYQFILIGAAVLIRIYAPGPELIRRSGN